jgi:hypothetical protein
MGDKGGRKTKEQIGKEEEEKGSNERTAKDCDGRRKSD